MEEIKKYINEIWKNENISEETKLMITTIIGIIIANTLLDITKKVMEDYK